MNERPTSGLPDSVAAAARQAADILFKALSPARTARPESAELIGCMDTRRTCIGTALTCDPVPMQVHPRITGGSELYPLDLRQ